MKTKPLPERDLLIACLDYCPTTGILIWKPRPEWTFEEKNGRTPSHMANAWNAAWAGKPAFTSITKNGYLQGTLNGVFYYAHRVIWKMVNGADPDDIDHDDGDRKNNRIDNLFSRTRTKNLQNRRLSRNNTSGYHGVSFHRTHKLWEAVIYANNKRIHLGWFKNLEDAVRSRLEAEKTYQYNPNHGRTA